MTTMLRLAKRGEAPYCSNPIYLENDNRKIVFANKSNYASILAHDDYDTTATTNSKKDYYTHQTLDEAVEYRRDIAENRHVVTIDRQGYIYDNYLNLNQKLILIKTNDMVALSPFVFLDNYKDIANTYAAILEFSSLVAVSDKLDADEKKKAHQLKELGYKVITLFKHTHELNIMTCIEFNDDFNINPAYAEKTLERLRMISSKLSNLLIGDKLISTEKNGNGLDQNDHPNTSSVIDGEQSI